MTRTQTIVLLSAVALFLILFFGFDTKPGKHKDIEKKRELDASSTDISSLLEVAKKEMDASQSTEVMTLESALESASSDSAKAEISRQLSRAFYQFGQPGMSGHYAEKVAEFNSTEDAWSIAGTTYLLCVQQENEQKVRSFCAERAVQSLEKAASLNPANPQHKVNLALVYAENPPQDNPMKGILMLRDLNEQYPKNVSVLTQLGRLAIKTSQFDRAVQRLEEAISVEPDNAAANCLLAKAYEGQGDAGKAAGFQSKCEKLTKGGSQ